jgi:hypothetical protein
MLRLFFILLEILSVLGYLILGKTRGVKEYTRAAVGIILILTGYMVLEACDTWLFLLSGSILLFFGGWIYLDKIHRYYLWQ